MADVLSVWLDGCGRPEGLPYMAQPWAGRLPLRDEQGRQYQCYRR